VGKTRQDPLVGFVAEMDIDTLAVVEREDAEVVDAMRVVGMLVRVEHGLDAIDVMAQELLAQVAASIDDDAGRCAVARTSFDQQGAAAAAVPGIGRIADAPIAADARHAARRAAAHDGGGDLRRGCHQRCALLKRRKKLSVVVALISASETLRRSASFWAVCKT